MKQLQKGQFFGQTNTTISLDGITLTDTVYTHDKVDWHYQWQYTPQHVVNSSGSLQMRSLDYAKYAQLYKNNGVWNGKQLLPAAWVQKTLTRQIQILIGTINSTAICFEIKHTITKA
ncbi:hypothetical protein AAEO56_09655 [Flavobacterium sp. DGU11]|uniref:Uncharacterized protein n=1 Tax=Flavobacterium arundinis TaxID=3139143 RepID=A0ABU9HX14_9FLAO